MRKFIPFTLFLLTIIPCKAQDKLLTPAEFLGYQIGERFTSHNRVVEYFRHVASVVPNAKLTTYGETYERRPLVYLVITSPGNFQQLDEIRHNNLRRAGMEPGAPSDNKAAIVWLSYNVHGNEASSMEAAMVTLHELADASNTRAQEWLKNAVVIIDPCVNPDGRDRYFNFYNQYGNKPPNPRYDALEHHESWPGGRSNHYLFDLNRDWAWCTQKESRQRLKAYNEWLPHVHVDFHEQSYNSPYFFAPAAEPLHEVISPWQRSFQATIGNNNARYFDEKGWLYFTGEVFDLYYPSYGDTYPTYSGAIGMTYEQAGGGAGGLAITTETGQALTLRDRIDHHHTSGLSTIEVSALNAPRIVEEFEKYFRENNTNPAAEYKSYVVKASNNPDKIKQLTEWMTLHGIRFGHPAATKPTRGYDFQSQTITPVSISTDDLVFNVYQPKSRFITTVFEPTSRLSDTLTYDITAWNLMYAYNLDAWAIREKIDINRQFEPTAVPPKANVEKPYAYIFRYNSLRDASFLAALLENDLRIRCAERPFSIEGKSFSQGSLIIARGNNDHLSGNFDETVTTLAGRFRRPVLATNSGLVEKGQDLGSSELRFIRKPEIALLSGHQVSSLSCGEIWHFFEQQVAYPVTQIGTGYFDVAILKSYDVFIVPEGNYKLFDEPTLGELASWVGNGGRLILIGSALDSFADKKGFSLKRYANDVEKRNEEEEKSVTELPSRYDEAKRKQLSDNISGAIYKAALDNSHPLAFGLKSHYYTLKTHERRYAWLSNGWNVSYFSRDANPIQGFAGYRANRLLQNSLLLGVEEIGRGEVVYFVDNPLFRSFWEDGKMLFANAIFLIGN